MVWIPEYSGGHLTRLDPRTGEFTRIPLPVRDGAPYVARVDAQSGRVWLGTGAADAILAWDPEPGRWTTYPLPSRQTLVRHLAIDPRNGDLWIAYGASPGPPSKVARLRAPD
jgi:streptogramin lyase